MNTNVATRHNLPSRSTSFIGRETDIAEITALLADPACRLLTLAGPGGAGKTSLALEVVQHLDLADGMFFVPLQPLASVDNIVTTIAEALPLQLHGNTDPQQQLLNYLREKHILLILDNFEHLLDGVSLVTDILDAAPHVRLLITSREALNVQAEHLWPLGGLPIPPDDALDMFDDYSSVRLFVERTRRAKPDFSPAAHRHEIVRICRLVDGLPLALEMAASWTRVLSPQAVGDEIERSIDFLATNQRDVPERHRSMRAVFDHSWLLLTDEEQAVFRTLSVFRGGFTLEAAEQVAGASLPLLASLIDKSLLRLDAASRYDLHELLRQYAEEKREAAGTDESTRDKYGAYYAAFLHERVEDLKGRRQIEAIVEINADFENIRTVWIWAADHKRTDIIGQMVDGLSYYCWIRGRARENSVLFRYAETRFAHPQSEPEQRIWGQLLSRSTYGSNPPVHFKLALEAFEIARKYNDLPEIAYCLWQRGFWAYVNQEHDQAIQLFEQSLSIYRQLGEPYDVARVLMGRITRDHRADWEEKRALAEELLRLQREIGDHVGRGWSLSLLALNEGRLGHFTEAERLLMERITIGRETGNLGLIATSYALISHQVCFFQGNFAQARAAADEALKLGNEISDSISISGASATLGLLANMNEDYSAAKRLCREAVNASVGYADFGKLATWGLAVASCGLGHYEGARAQLSTALHYLSSVQGVVGQLASLPVAAIIYAHQGYAVRAVEWLALALSHPVSNPGWMAKWPLLDRLQEKLKQTLGTNEFSAAWQRGQYLDLQDVIIEMRAQFPGSDTVTTKPVTQMLPDPLSQRELKVLALIAAGLTNREIAERLFIGVSTVKKHIQHIYAKLDTRNRTSAVLRARELNLLP